MAYQVKSRRARWPKYLIIPDVEGFNHGSWVKTVDEDNEGLQMIAGMAADNFNYPNRSLTTEEVETLRYDCGTRACLVGWTALAMGEGSCIPEDLRNPATAKFLNKIIELAGGEPVKRRNHSLIDFICTTAYRASHLFEGTRDDDSLEGAGSGSLSSAEARDLWMEAGESFGYDTGNLVE